MCLYPSRWNKFRRQAFRFVKTVANFDPSTQAVIEGGRSGRFPGRGFDRGGGRGRGHYFSQEDRGGRGRGMEGRGFGEGRGYSHVRPGFDRGHYGPEGNGIQGRGAQANNRGFPLPPPMLDFQSSGGSYAALASQPPPPAPIKLEMPPTIEPIQQEVVVPPEPEPPTPPPSPVPETKSPSPPPSPPRSPAPEPAPPSGFHLLLIHKRKVLRAQIQKLETLPIGADAFKDDLTKLIADLEKSKQESEQKRKEEQEEEDDLYAELEDGVA
ncbi:hypothetical protein MHU86_13388 [Fragilaria crotonensis]|nr:hypothetical protein MHU86_13388 [Fragilaria crotonensis]